MVQKTRMWKMLEAAIRSTLSVSKCQYNTHLAVSLGDGNLYMNFQLHVTLWQVVLLLHDAKSPQNAQFRQDGILTCTINTNDATTM